MTLRRRLARLLDRAVRRLSPSTRVGTNENGTLDEIFGWGFTHLEQLDDDAWFLEIDGVAMTLGRQGKRIVALPRDLNHEKDWERWRLGRARWRPRG